MQVTSENQQLGGAPAVALVRDDDHCGWTRHVSGISRDRFFENRFDGEAVTKLN